MPISSNRLVSKSTKTKFHNTFQGKDDGEDTGPDDHLDALQFRSLAVANQILPEANGLAGGNWIGGIRLVDKDRRQPGDAVDAEENQHRGGNDVDVEAERQAQRNTNRATESTSHNAIWAGRGYTSRSACCLRRPSDCRAARLNIWRKPQKAATNTSIAAMPSARISVLVNDKVDRVSAASAARVKPLLRLRHADTKLHRAVFCLARQQAAPELRRFARCVGMLAERVDQQLRTRSRIVPLPRACSARR